MEKAHWRQFESEWTNGIVDSINFVREQQGWTIKDLAERLESAGWPVSNATLAGILSGRKRGSVSVAELTAFARALDVSPTFLFLGLPFYANMPNFQELWGRESATTVSVAAWLRAYTGPPPVGSNEQVAAQAREAVNLVMHYSNTRRAVAWQAALVVVASTLTAEERSQLSERHVLGRARLVSVARNLASFYSDVETLGAFAPPLPAVPAPLEGLDRAEVERAINQMTLDELEELTSEERLEDARGYWLTALEEIRASTS